MALGTYSTLNQSVAKGMEYFDLLGLGGMSVEGEGHLPYLNFGYHSVEGGIVSQIETPTNLSHFLTCAPCDPAVLNFTSLP